MSSNVAIGNSVEIEVSIGKSPIKGPLFIAMFDYRRATNLITTGQQQNLTLTSDNMILAVPGAGTASTVNPQKKNKKLFHSGNIQETCSKYVS